MPALLTAASTLQCPHGGAVTATAGGRAKADAAVLTVSDSFTIAGCPFSTPAGPQPCLTVQWVSPGARVKVDGALALNASSVGLCVGPAPQGTVVIAGTQGKVNGL